MCNAAIHLQYPLLMSVLLSAPWGKIENVPTKWRHGKELRHEWDNVFSKSGIKDGDESGMEETMAVAYKEKYCGNRRENKKELLQH